MLKIETRIDPVEIDGSRVEGIPKEVNQVVIEAHWNINRFVIIKFKDKVFTVDASELRKAIENATNH